MKQLNIIEEQLKPSKDPVPSSRLKWLPGWEGVLKYDPQDIERDQPMRLWHVIKRGGKKVLFELKPYLEDYRTCRARRLSRFPRVRFIFMEEGKMNNLLRSHLYFIVLYGRKINKGRRVVDHKDSNQLNDRPSNLQLITQRENLKRSKLFREANKDCTEEKARKAKLRLDWMNRERERIVNVWGGEVLRMDVEIELALRLQEVEFVYPKDGGIVARVKGGNHVEG